MRLSTEERETISSFLKKADSERRKNSKMRIMGSPALFRLCHREEKSLLKKFLALDPRTYDFKGGCYGIFP
ncbi:MAG: hypothetical protein Q7S52_05300, partial [bacterium]|nr:hypothetical protein [bacterium]